MLFCLSAWSGSEYKRTVWPLCARALTHFTVWLDCAAETKAIFMNDDLPLSSVKQGLKFCFTLRIFYTVAYSILNINFSFSFIIGFTGINSQYIY
jgi:hypothetical protein